MPVKKLASIGWTGRILLIVAFGMTAATSAKAIGTAEQRAACTPDALRLCSSEIPDVGRVTACMRSNYGSLSPRCRAAFDSASPSRPAAVAQRSFRSDRETYHQAGYHRYHQAAHQRGSFHQASFLGDMSFLPRHGKHHHFNSRQAMRIAAQVFGMLSAACQSGSAPAEICNNGFLGGRNRGYASYDDGGFPGGYNGGYENFGSSDLSSMGSLLSESGLMESFMQ